jgi:large subunit ribosomal protein L21
MTLHETTTIATLPEHRCRGATATFEEGTAAMYAIVKTGGKQYKVAEGDVIEIEKLEGEPGSTVALPAVLVVDGDELTTDAAALAKVSVSAEIVAASKGPKIIIHKFKNKTGYHKRQGHRQPLVRVKVTGISVG